VNSFSHKTADKRGEKTSLSQKGTEEEKQEEILRTFSKYDTGVSLSRIERPMVQPSRGSNTEVWLQGD